TGITLSTNITRKFTHARKEANSKALKYIEALSS
ncbi:unnamed protein product, partial [Allacma fusca]